MLAESKKTEKPNASKLPFGYYVERSPDLLTLHRADGSFVAAFSVRGVDSLEVELTVWEDAD